MYAPKREHPEQETADSWFDLADTVGLGRMNGRRDVFKVESILADAGDLDFAGTNGPAGYGLYTLDDGVRKYQKRNGLKVDGWLRPDGPTVTKMHEQFGDRFAGFPAPSQEQIEQHHALAAEGGDGLLVARPPRIELKKRKSYPPVDPETHGSNTSWVEFLTRNRTNFDGAPEMLATYIKIHRHASWRQSFATSTIRSTGARLSAATCRKARPSARCAPRRCKRSRGQAMRHSRAKAGTTRTSNWRHCPHFSPHLGQDPRSPGLALQWAPCFSSMASTKR